MPNALLENLNKRSSEFAEKGQHAINTAYHRSLDVLGLDEDEVRGRFEQLRERGQQLEGNVQKAFQEQLKELQFAEVRLLGRLEEGVSAFKDSVTSNFNRLSESLDKLEKRLQEVEKTLSNRIHKLPIEDYDRLNADEVVKRVDSLDAEALRAIREYESQHKGRVTVLKAIDSRIAA